MAASAPGRSSAGGVMLRQTWSGNVFATRSLPGVIPRHQMCLLAQLKRAHDTGMAASPIAAALQLSPVFIGGIPRSGTTLLRSLLDGHPQLLVHPGRTGFFSIFVPAARGKNTKERIALAERTLRESGKAEADRGAGVIRDPAVHDRVLRELQSFVDEQRLRWRGVTESPVLGPAGNKEFLTWIEKAA